MKSIRYLTSIEGNPPIAQVCQSGVVPKCIQVIRERVSVQNPENKTREESKKCKLQFEAAWILTNIASAESQHTQKLFRQGAIEAFMQLLLNTSDHDCADQALWGLGNIASDSVECRDAVLRVKSIDPYT